MYSNFFVQWCNISTETITSQNIPLVPLRDVDFVRYAWDVDLLFQNFCRDAWNHNNRFPQSVNCHECERPLVGAKRRQQEGYDIHLKVTTLSWRQQILSIIAHRPWGLAV